MKANEKIKYIPAEITVYDLAYSDILTTSPIKNDQPFDGEPDVF